MRKQMEFIAIIYWDKTCCHPESASSNQIEATLMAGEKNVNLGVLQSKEFHAGEKINSHEN